MIFYPKILKEYFACKIKIHYYMRQQRHTLIKNCKEGNFRAIYLLSDLYSKYISQTKLLKKKTEKLKDYGSNISTETKLKFCLIQLVDI